MSTPLRVIVLGLDGATWTLLRPWAEAGILPNLATLMEKGIYGELMSSIPPYTAPAWTSFATGKWPGKHGITDFWQFSWKTGGRVPVHLHHIQRATFWSILSRHGRRVGVINVPLTYPPYPVNGLMISGMLTPSEAADYTFPPSLKAELRSAIGNYAANPYASVSRTRSFLKRVAYWIRQRERANQYLLKNYEFDCFINIIQAPDPIQHQFWKVLDPNHPLHDPQEAARFEPLILDCYRAIDEVIGNRLRMLDGRTLLFVLSDHGFGPAYKYFYVNRFLASLGLLTFRGDQAKQQPQNMIGNTLVPLVSRLVRRVDLLGLRYRLLDNRQREAIRQRLDHAVAPPIDWSQTKAYFSGLTGEAIYIHLRGRDSDGIVEPGVPYEELRKQIIRALLELRDPQTGEIVVAGAYRREELYDGPYVDQLPDIVFSLADRPYLPSEQLATSTVIAPLPGEAGGGRHQPTGIFLAAGAGIQHSGSFASANIVDLAPTILFALGVPVPADMDGRVLTEMFDPTFVARHPIQIGPPVPMDALVSQTSYTDAEIASIESHLRDLGYLD